jgi:hypothetical protein
LYAEGNPYSHSSAPHSGPTGEIIRQRWQELPKVLESVSAELTIPALLGVQAINTVPESFVGPLQRVAAGIAVRIRKFRESLDPQDPDTFTAERIKQGYSLWRTAWERAAADKRLPPPAELETIEREASQVKDIDAIKSIASQAKADFVLWSESAKQKAAGKE